MHDRHSGVGVEVPAVYVEVQQENLVEPGDDSVQMLATRKHV